MPYNGYNCLPSVIERIEISLVEACERVRKSVVLVSKKAGLTDQF